MPALLLDAIVPGEIKADHPVHLIAFILVLVVAAVAAVIVKKRKK